MAEPAVAQPRTRDIAALLRKTQHQLARNWMLDCISRALWWPATLLAIGAGLALFGYRAPWPWLAATALLTWAIATTLLARGSRGSRGKIGDPAHWLDRVSDGRGLFVTTAHMLKSAEPLSPAGQYLFASAQRRVPNARARSAALIGWRVPRHVGFAVLLVLCSLALLTRPAGVDRVGAANAPIVPPTIATQEENTVQASIENATVAQSTLAKKLAHAFNQNDRNSAYRTEAKEPPTDTLNVASAHPPDAASNAMRPTEHGASEPLGNHANSAQGTDEATTKPAGATVPGSGRLAGSDADNSSRATTRNVDAQWSLAKTEFVDLALQSGSIRVAQDRSGAPLRPSATPALPYAPAASVASPARPNNIPLPTSFGPLERTRVADYFRELSENR